MPREQCCSPPARPCLLGPGFKGAASRAAPLGILVSLRKKCPVASAEGCPAAASSPRGGLLHLHQRPAKAPGFLFYSEDVEAFQQCCSRSLPTYFEKYPASVEHLSVKGEEIPPCYYFLLIVLAWCGFGYYGFVK